MFKANTSSQNYFTFDDSKRYFEAWINNMITDENSIFVIWENDDKVIGYFIYLIGGQFKDYPLYKELKSIVFKTVGVLKGIKDILEEIGNVKFAFIYGSYAKARETYLSDIDLTIIGNPDEDRLIKELDRLEGKLQREINYKLYTLKEFKKEVKENEPFVLEILREKKVMVIGDENGRLYAYNGR